MGRWSLAVGLHNGRKRLDALGILPGLRRNRVEMA